MPYTKQQIKDILMRHQSAPLFTEKQKIASNAKHESFAEEMKKIFDIAEEAMAQPERALSFSMYKEFEVNGSRYPYEAIYMERRKKLNALVLTACVTGDDKYIPYIEEELWTWSNEFAWALPAHFDKDLLNPNGMEGVPHAETIDLCAAETAYMLAEIDAVLEDRLSPFIRSMMKKETKRRVLMSFLNPNHSFWWEYCDHNWAAVCGCSVAAAAMYYLNDAEQLADIIYRVIASMERFLSGYNKDGACVEGVSYWGYGFSYFIFFAELLKERTEGEINLTSTEKIHQIALYLQRCRTVKNKVINFSDSADIFTYRICLLHKLKSIFPDVIVPPEKYAMRCGADHCFRWAGFIRDYTWFEPDFCGCVDKTEENYFFSDAQIYITHKNGACFAVTGGNNGYNHNHNDLGHFMYYSGGEDIFVDIGQGVYCKGYFDEEKRYGFINNSSCGHSVPQVGGWKQLSGREHYVEDMQVVRGESDFVEMELAKAYGRDVIQSLRRRFEFRADGSLILSDSFILTEANTISERFVVDVTCAPEQKDGYIVLKKNDVTLRLMYDKCFTEVNFENLPYELRSTSRSKGIYIITLTVEKATKLLETVFKIEKI